MAISKAHESVNSQNAIGEVVGKVQMRGSQSATRLFRSKACLLEASPLCLDVLKDSAGHKAQH